VSSPPDSRPSSLIRHYLKTHRWRYAAGFVLLALTNLLALSVPRLLKHAVDMLQADDRSGLVRISLLVVAVAVVQAAVRTCSRLTILGASRHVAYQLRDRLFRHLQRLPLGFYNRRAIGDISSRAINDMLLVRSFFGPGMMNLVNTTLVYVTALAMMLAMDVRLTLLALAPYPFFMLAVNRLGRRIYGRTMKVQEQLSSITAKAQENISAINLIKTYAREEQEARSWSRLSAEYFDRALSLARARGAMAPLMGIMASLGTLAVIGFGGKAVIEGRISLGDFVAFNAYLSFLVWPTFAFGWILNTFQRGFAALGRVCEILQEQPEDRQEESAAALPPLRGALRFRSLTFAHEGAAPEVRHLKGIDLEVPAGGTLGILGTVGSGKSTLVNLLPRVLSPPQGSVFIDGEDVTRIPLATLRRDIAVIPQEAFLFSRSIRDNIRLAPDAGDDHSLRLAVERSRLERDLPQLPRGLDTVVGERGFTLSGGQRQRATIARALVKDAPVLILDDALSSLDAEVEKEVIGRLRDLKARQTLVIISNRISALSWADQIIVMDHGEIVERGRHEELLRGEGLYASIARRQSLADSIEEIDA